MTDYSNYTLFGVQDVVTRKTWAGWLILVMMTSIIGDSTILIASIHYKAFKLHSTLVVFIEHIAASDLILCVFSLFSSITSLIANKWVFGLHLCTIRVFMCYFAFLAGILFICAVTICKVLLLKYPDKTRYLSRKEAQAVCAGIWLFSLLISATFLSFGRKGILFDYRIYTCEFSFANHLTWLVIGSNVMFILFPNLSIIFCTTILVKHLLEAKKVAKRCGGTAPVQGIITVILTATIYSISTMPYTVFHFLQDSIGGSDSVVITFYRIAWTFLWFGITSNVFIYSVTVRSFRRFLRSRVNQVAPFLSSLHSDTTDGI